VTFVVREGCRLRIKLSLAKGGMNVMATLITFLILFRVLFPVNDNFVPILELVPWWAGSEIWPAIVHQVGAVV